MNADSQVEIARKPLTIEYQTWAFLEIAGQGEQAKILTTQDANGLWSCTGFKIGARESMAQFGDGCGAA
jgi:hypothetical protein